MRVVIALGGNALVRRGEPVSVDIQRENLTTACDAIAEIARSHDVVVTHGNGPQIGQLALDSPYPLDVLGAESEGLIGYMIEQELGNRLPGRSVATLLTQVEVDPADPAFDRPSKPIGPVYEHEQAEQLARVNGWRIAPDGAGWRRVVASPEPRRILEISTIRLLVTVGVLVVCAGGGGVPVVAMRGRGVRGVEAVIDKDLAAALLAIELRADHLLMLTDVEAVFRHWRTKQQTPILQTMPGELRALRFEAGTIGPKIEAACRFVERGGRLAGIGRLADAMAILEGRAGTRVTAASASGTQLGSVA